MKQICKKIIIIVSVLTYLSTIQAMAMMMPAGFQRSHCNEAHSTVVEQSENLLLTEGFLDAEASLAAEGSINQNKDSSNDGQHCMTCFAITDEANDSVSDSQAITGLQKLGKEFCSVAINILSPPPKRHTRID